MPRCSRVSPDRRARAAKRSATCAFPHTKRARGAGLSDRNRSSDPREGRSHHGLPPRVVFSRPPPGRALIAEDVSVLRIRGELPTYLLRDCSEVAQHSTFRAVLDRCRELGTCPHRADEVVNVQLRQPVVSHGVETVGLRCPRCDLPDNLVLEIVDDVPVTIDYHAAIGAEDGRATGPPIKLEPIAALALPDDALAAFEHERRFLGVGELPVVGVMEASARRDDSRRVVDPEHPPTHVDLVRSIVADLTGPPVSEPVPIVVDDVVAIGSARSRTLPQLIVQIRWHRNNSPLPY